MDYKGWLWLPCLATIAVILSSLLWFRRLLTKRGIPIEQTTGTAANPATASASSAGFATATATASTAEGKFEVFLSFCGKDTRHGFADFLYTDLVEKRIRTFRDNEELPVGEEIRPELLKAIKESKISIPIFSKNYASSKWCLRELTQMVECKRSMAHEIYPIFYDVQPSDVRHQTGSYEEAFHKHKKDFDERTVKGWKEALTEVGQLKGWELQKETGGRQGKLAKIVVQRVLLELKKNYMDVSEDLVGIDHHLEEVMGLLNVNSSDVWIVGIHGMGGIGKTTIAKVIFNKLFENFECCCFLEDVRETSQSREGLVNLQNQLISKILRGKSLDIANVDEGINTIKETVHRKRVLIVLDDVNEKSQFDKLAGKCDWFGSGSRIIVTTRNKEVLNVLDVDKAYEAPYMELDNSLQLFSRHAFREDFPTEGYDFLSKEIISVAAGLPLALKIIGSSLYGKRKEIWEETLIKLKKIPNEDVQKKLRVSYDALNDEQKQIFLDIACHFVGQRSINPFYMWDDCEFHPKIGVDELVLRSLVQIEGNDVLRMHDQLRDLGREIVRKKNFKELEEHSRLWLHQVALDILENRRWQGTERIETLSINLQEARSDELCFTNEEFRQLPNLRFLGMDKVDLTGDFKHLFSNLRWLQWWRCPRNFSPTNFHVKNLVILDLSYSNITDKWKGWSQIKGAKNLKALYLRGCSGLTRTPDFCSFAALERLILSSCKNLVQIDPSIADLKNLRVLDIKYSGITKLPDVIGNLGKLEEIDASCCSNLQGQTPSSIGRLSSLRILRLNHTKICSLPTSIRGLPSLQALDLTGCRELQSLPELPPSLTSLRVTCKFLGIFSSLSNLINLKQLSFCECLYLEEIPGDTISTGLRSLRWYNILRRIGALTHLKELKVQDDLRRIGWIPSIYIDGCRTVEFIQCSKLMEIQGLEKLEWLTSLDASDLSNLMQFKKLATVNCRKLIGIQGRERLADLSNLRMLKYLSRCKKLAEVRDLRGLKSLEILDISCCTSLEIMLNDT